MQSPEPSLAPVAGDAASTSSSDAAGSRGGHGDSARGTLVFGFPRVPGWRGELLIVAFLALVTIAMTWPIAISLDRATGLRGDYFNNIWNVWWLRHSIVEGHSPFWTDYLYCLDGLSLKRHTLSMTNALVGVGLRSFFGAHATFNVLLLMTFVASAWTFSLFARYLTGSLFGAVLAGLVYSFNPFHYFYICQVNVFSFQWLPLVLLYFVRVHREGGVRNTILAAVFTGLMAATVEYFVIYAVMAVGMMLVLGKLLDRRVPVTTGARRLLVAGLLTGVAVALAAAPLLIGTFGAESDLPGRVTMGLQKRRANDLLGFYWIGGPEVATVSWGTMLGYSTLLIVLAGVKRVVTRQAFWVVVGAVFFVLGLGKSLVIDGEDTGIGLAYAWLDAIPGLEMLRKPDRSFYLVQLVVALLVAEAWPTISGWFSSARTRTIAWAVTTALVMVELTGAPFDRYAYDPPEYLATLAQDDSVETVFEMPPMQIDVMNARYSFFQTVHEKKQPLGYCTALALNKVHHDRMETVVNTYLPWVVRQGVALPRWIRDNGFDRVILYKTWPLDRAADESIQGRTYWEPFFLVRKELVRIRQQGQYIDVPLTPQQLAAHTQLLFREFGAPVHDDERIAVYDVKGSPR